MNEPATLKRPKPGDGEEELFRMQEEFLKSRQEPSAKVINLRGASKQNKDAPSGNIGPAIGNVKPTGKIVSKFAERKALKMQGKISTSVSEGQMINPGVSQTSDNVDKSLSDSVQNIPLNPSNIILGNIVEKKYNNGAHQKVITEDFVKETVRDVGFPKVFCINHRQALNKESSSLFMQNISKSPKLSPNLQKTSASSLSSTVSTPELIQSEDSLKEEIHQTNLEKLNQMSVEEILQAKSQLESTISPDLLNFLKARKASSSKSNNSSKSSDKNAEKMEITENNKIEIDRSEELNAKMECDVESIEQETPVGELVEEASTKGWIHMDTIEPEKLEWMKDATVKKIIEPAPNEPYNARFDFNGVLLPFQDDNLTVDKGLHHHGEEPERPGYSLQELLQLCRSSTQQQRCTALTTLANIMEKSRKGWYDKVLSPAPLIALNEKNILLLLRFSLDDTSIAVVTATLQALRAFLYSEVDEICLDRLFGWNYNDGKFVEPELIPPKTDIDDTRDLKDHELAQFDTVAAAMRSDIVLRIRYILSEMQPPPIGVTAALEILIRLSRQSRITALNIASTPGLLDTIIRNFIPLSTDRSIFEDGTRNAYHVPSSIAVKLCRVLVSYAGKPVADKLNNLQIVHSLMSYSTSTTTIGIRLSIESLRCWKLLLTHKVALDSISGARLAFVSQLQLLLSNHDLGSSSELVCEHAAALIDLAVHEHSLKTNISTLLEKWSTQLASISSPTWSQTKLVAQTLTAVGDDAAFKCPWTSNSKIFASLCSTSNLLSGFKSATERDPTSLPNLGVLTQNGQLQPAVSLNSCVPFLATWINIFVKTCLIAELQSVLNNPDLIKYIRRLSSHEWSLENSWYTRAELYLVTGLVRAGMCLGDIANEQIKKIVLKIAIKLVSTLPGDAFSAVREVLKIILTNDRLTVDKLARDLNNLKLEVGNSGASDLSNLPNNLSSIYEEFVSNNGSWNEAAMPKDWLYLPLVAAYTDHKNKIVFNENYTAKIVALLSLESSMPELAQTLSPSLRFSRLILIYLCDTIYLNENVSVLLIKAMTKLLQNNYESLDFSSDLPGLASFTDLFTSMCESFCANSYGNNVFSMALLVPIAQRHDVHYRKLLWSEHAGALRYLRIKSEDLIIPVKEYFYPLEEDSSLIESYLTALVRGTVNKLWCPLMYKIALHHSAIFIRGENKLAVRMRRKIGELRDKELSETLLNYSPSET